MLTAKQTRFVEAYLVNPSPKESAINAGYPEKSAASIGWQLLKNERILRELDSKRTQLRVKITKESFIDKAMDRFERLPDTEPNSPRFLDIAGKALGYIGNNDRPNQTINITQNKLEINSLPAGAKWQQLRNILESD